MGSEIEIEGQPELNKPKLQLEEEEEEDEDNESWRDDEFYAEDENGLHEMNPKQWDEYLDHLEKSGGFDVPYFPNTIFYGIQPRSIYNPWTYGEVKNCSVFATEEHKKNQGTDFKYYRIVKANSELVAGFIYYTTFLAEDLKNVYGDKVEIGPSGCPIVELQAKVYSPIPDEEGNIKMELLEFNIKDTLSDEGLKALEEIRNVK